ncbi:carbon-nitrogen hydrolase [Gigaspora margarita]|uniref:Carbon-nitrogen hydrolase n=1 Tax=Gigaspora margarita TaxID=4874 RepID=A0A8H4EQX9_GIGMA|nr:carbon-nitrogen hydrolase [Gigaspora margarita]
MCLAAVTQFCGTNDISKNLKICIDLINDASQKGAKMIFFPEASDFTAINNEEALSLTSSIENLQFIEEIKNSAKKNNIWVSIGVHENSHLPSRIYNSHVLITSSGTLIQPIYHKLHLFDISIQDGPQFMESSYVLKGENIIDPVETPVGKVGMMVCYDLRFPELSLELRKRGADVLTYPAAFTLKTGMAHWEVLLRARAIETQTYVIASAHIGKQNENRTSFGSAMIVDPWGTILARCPETTQPSFALAEINLDRLKNIRIGMPVLEHRRTDLFGESSK